MGTTVERSKKKVQLWKKAIVHFMLCFVMGFFTGFAPTSKNSMFFYRVSISSPSEFSPQPLENLHRRHNNNNNNNATTSYNRNLLDGRSTTTSPTTTPATVPLSSSDHDHDRDEGAAIPRKLIIVVTPTTIKDQLRGVHLRRLGNTLRLVAPPLLWVVVEQQQQQQQPESNSDDEVSEILRQTGIMYRHLVFKENFTGIQAEMDYQRNFALSHIEHHRLTGIVHFAGLSNVYDLNFFNQIRTIEVFGTWPMAFLSANRNKVKIEGPVCESSEVKGWHLKTTENLTDIININPSIHISSFAFNSSILWDPERWGRTSSAQDTSQDSLKFVKKEVVEEETNLKGIPFQDCSKVLVWSLQIPV